MNGARKRTLEERILLWCVRDRSRNGPPAFPGGAAVSPDWPAVFRLALEHRILPLVSVRLKEPPDLLEPEPGRRLEELFRGQARRSLLLAAELVRIVSLLEARGIPVLCLKGPALAQAAYGDLLMRQFTDLDFLVPPSYVQPAAAALQEAGFARLVPLTDKEERVHLQREDELTFRLNARGYSIDIHWAASVGPAYPALPVEELFARRGRTQVLDRRLRVLAPEDQVLYLCLHSTRHLWERLQFICDLAAVLKSQREWDWSALVHRAAAAGSRRILLLGLAIVDDVTGTNFAAKVPRNAGLDQVASLRRLVTDDLLWGGAAGLPAGSIGRERFRLQTLDGTRDRIRYLCGRLFLPTVEDVQAVPLPGFLQPLHHVIRPWRLAAGAVRWRARTGRRE